MYSASLNNFVAFNRVTREVFSQHLHENPHNRRVSQSDEDILIEWLTNPHKRPVSQEEFSRRNYVRKTFAWDEENQTLLAVAKKDEGRGRTVITTGKIADVVETVHINNGHAGWDATWKDVSTSYYGILRSDVIFLLKQCQVCAQNPSKRPKGSPTTIVQPQHTDHESLNFLNIDDMQYDNPIVGKQENEVGSLGRSLNCTTDSGS
ncbi:hypothetical protein BCON_0362g00060 [Botryotinia convoluta]|uniref:Integrase zinc-binding domain-containing protein n=1 Tax=Botryotinia convoluta TaxID=54673 RepID=A0A4Z1HAJ3_9HELO|nr:hypothetical protein BCON_0362g00060 [Botryotinia convoluta]